MTSIVLLDSDGLHSIKCCPINMIIELINNCQRGIRPCRSYYKRMRLQIQKKKKKRAEIQKALEGFDRLYQDIDARIRVAQGAGGLWVRKGHVKKWIVL
jgi:hypothetical protein